MKVSSTVAVGLLAASSNAQSITCAQGLYILVARGSDEAPGVGRIGVVAGNVSLAIPGSITVPLTYPATFDNYLTSEFNGTEEMTTKIANYVSQCPNGKIALLGYSQGGQVTMDTLCGESEAYFNTSTPLPVKYKANVVAAITFGDPSHVVNVPWDVGTSKHNGLFNRTNTAACNPYADRIRGWCDTGDIYCDSGNITGVHGTYFANYTFDAVNFIVGKYNASLAGGSNSTTTVSPSAPSSAPSQVPTNGGLAVAPSLVAASSALVAALLYSVTLL